MLLNGFSELNSGPRRGFKDVATGGAQWNPWKRSIQFRFRPRRGGGILHIAKGLTPTAPHPIGYDRPHVPSEQPHGN